MQVPTDFRIIPNPSEFQAVEKCNVDTRSAEATPLYIWGPFKPDMFHFGILLCLTISKGARMFEACSDQILEFEQEAGRRKIYAQSPVSGTF